MQPLKRRAHLGRSHRIEVIEPPAEGRAAGSIEIPSDADPGEGGYSNVYVTIRQAVLTPRARLNKRDLRTSLAPVFSRRSSADNQGPPFSRYGNGKRFVPGYAQRNMGAEDMNVQASRDAEGYLINPDDWNQEVANELAKEEGIELNDAYWPILHFMRKYYGERHVAPDVRHLTDYLATENQCDKKAAKKLIFELFPYGYVKQACKIAGMKRPRAWSTG